MIRIISEEEAPTVLGRSVDRVGEAMGVSAPIVADVRLRGDEALKEYRQRFDLVALDEVSRLIGEVITETNAELANDPKSMHLQIQRFILLPKRLDVDDGEVTRLRKVRREAVLQRYASLIEALYDGSTVGHFNAPVRHEDGSADRISAKIKIGNAQIFTTSPSQKAA